MKRTLLSLVAVTCFALAARSQITNVNVGAAPNDGTGDPARTAFGKLNSNDTWLSSQLSNLNESNDWVSAQLANQTDTNNWAEGRITDLTTKQPNTLPEFGFFGVEIPYSTDIALPLTSPNWGGLEHTYFDVSVVLTNNMYLVNRDLLIAFLAHTFAREGATTNVNFSAHVRACDSTKVLGLYFYTNVNVSDTPRSQNFTIPTSGSNVSWDVSVSGSGDAAFKILCGNPGAAFLFSNVSFTLLPAPTDPVLGQPFKHYDIFKRHIQQSAYWGKRPWQATEGSRVTFYTDANQATFDFYGAASGGTFAASIYTNGVLCATHTSPSGNTYCTLTNVQLGNSSWKRVDVVNSYATAPDAPIFVSGNPKTQQYGVVVLRSVYVPTTNSISFVDNPRQRSVFVFGDSLSGTGGSFANTADNSVWPLVERFSGIKATLFAAGYWSLYTEYVHTALTRSNFWENVRLSKDSGFWNAIGRNDYTLLNSNNFHFYYDQLVKGVHALHPEWTLYCQALLASKDDGKTNAFGSTPQDYNAAISNITVAHPQFTIYVPQLLTTNDLDTGGVHPTIFGNIKYANEIVKWLARPNPNTPVCMEDLIAGFRGSGLWTNGAQIWMDNTNSSPTDSNHVWAATSTNALGTLFMWNGVSWIEK
jgi:hypothetical protein